ncbi:MAG: fibronectin type III domain-containing protein [Verrucomicrobiaceae bacterium]|nr:fibronectin type III domain-containing protein [Verrucomicrobiaceae bacterium]
MTTFQAAKKKRLSFISRALAFLLIAAVVPGVYADIKMRPKAKIPETGKDFKREVDKYGLATPEPRNAEAAFYSGKSVDIVLEAATRYLGTVKFEIREQPAHGKLSQIRPHPGEQLNKAIVTYTHNGDNESLLDRFTYVVSIGTGSTSVAATVTLKGTKPLPLLEVVENPRFGKIQPGGSGTAKALVRNLGTAAFDSLITWPAPFSGPPTLKVEPGQEIEILLQGRPVAVGSYTLNHMLQPGVEKSRIKGLLDCILPFVITPSGLELKYDAASGSRKGVTKITNASDVAMKLTLDPGARVQVPASIEIAPKESVELPVSLPADDVTAFRGEVWVMLDTQKEKLFVTALPEPAQARLVAPLDGKIDFGTVEKGKVGEMKITIANDGGEELMVSAPDVPPFSLVKHQTRVGAKAQADFLLAFDAGEGGRYTKTFTLGGNGGVITLQLAGTMNDPRRMIQPGQSGDVQNPHLDRSNPERKGGAAKPSASSGGTRSKGFTTTTTTPPPPQAAVKTSNVSLTTTPVVTPTSRSVVSPKTEDESGTTEAKLAPLVKWSEMSPTVQMAAGLAQARGFGIGDDPNRRSKVFTEDVKGIGLLATGRDHLVIGWQSPEPEPARYQVEYPVMIASKTTGLLTKTWLPMKEWEPASAPDGMTAAKVYGLSPGSQYEFRVCAIDGDDKFSLPSDVLITSTLPPLRMPWWVWTILSALVVLAGVLIVNQRLSSR